MGKGLCTLNPGAGKTLYHSSKTDLSGKPASIRYAICDSGTGWYLGHDSVLAFSCHVMSFDAAIDSIREAHGLAPTDPDHF